MPEANMLVMRRAVFLWIGAGLMLGLNIFAASQQNMAIIYLSLALTAGFTIGGVVFGIWAARKVTSFDR